MASDAGFTNILAVYGQEYWHRDVMVIGDRGGLTVLRDVIDRALAKGAAEADVLVQDGEGYTVYVARGDSYAELADLRVPYKHPVARSEHGASAWYYVLGKLEAGRGD